MSSTPAIAATDPARPARAGWRSTLSFAVTMADDSARVLDARRARRSAFAANGARCGRSGWR